MFAGIWETLPHVSEMNTAIKRKYNVGIRKTMSIETYLGTMWTFNSYRIIASICVQVSLTTGLLTFILYLLVSSADYHNKQFIPRSSDGIPERIFRKKLILKKISRRQISIQIHPVGKELQSNFDDSNSSGPSVRVRPIHVFERYLA